MEIVLKINSILARWTSREDKAQYAEDVRGCLEIHQEKIMGDLGGAFPPVWALLEPPHNIDRHRTIRGIDGHGNEAYAIHCFAGDHMDCLLFPDTGTRSANRLRLTDLATVEI
ncbi:hypothetical protein IW262DRAFT_1459422 [Armillaria fumosa]|nr:hypothetical protein IW262DRAFT_1459422 [Armillaria fumosa]